MTARTRYARLASPTRLAHERCDVPDGSPHSPACACASCRADLTACSLATFGAAVRAATELVGAAPECVGAAPIEHLGARRVFVSAVYGELARSGHVVGTLDTFESRLILANRAGHLELARGDLVGAMPREAVAASEIRDRGAKLRFVVDAEARDPREVAGFSVAAAAEDASAAPVSEREATSLIAALRSEGRLGMADAVESLWREAQRCRARTSDPTTTTA